MRYEALINVIVEEVNDEKLQGFVSDAIMSSEKGRFIMVAPKRSSMLRLWTLRLAFLIMLWTIVVQLRGFGDMLTPSMFNTHSASSLPHHSTYLNLLQISHIKNVCWKNYKV